MSATPPFPPTHAAALAALHRFVPEAGARYATRRNFDLGPGRHHAVSQLSPYLRHRVLTEEEVLHAVLARHSPETADKFIQEVFWRTYWKGWLELRPSIWQSYRSQLLRQIDRVQSEGGLRQRWQAACTGETGLDCFDTWAQELGRTGYLHNHARMWFASIWIFTLQLPWELGADFFLRHLLDGDPASNTLSWRWVAGLQTRGKAYVAQPENIARFTEGRFTPAHDELNTAAAPLDGPPPPPPLSPPAGGRMEADLPTLFVLHEDDLSPGWLLDSGLRPAGTALLTSGARLSPLDPAPQVTRFRADLVQETADRWQAQLGPTRPARTAGDIAAMAKELGVEQIVTAHAPTGPVAEILQELDNVAQLLRPYDARAWPHARAGFFKFRKSIPSLLAALNLPA
ncbi:FAD-binding domain-containing protein [Mameliella alba]|uniref:FAD-binding domain-containing protein n=1 Tax=Mameliella alba TaxID=561184 RepID=UPI000B538C1B|nr:FAD-binding domain-containing protein [Mameliella alba]MBY6118219.1 DNA photolyase [Mameliella alba]OWV42354.1 DNA photolyase [Mameliella alba]OWV56974.1 DNA photolyase [Mameliella alba]